MKTQKKTTKNPRTKKTALAANGLYAKRHITAALAVMLLFGVFGAATLWNAQAEAVIYHLSPDGSDSNSGTSKTSAWKTFQHALPKLKCGDVLLVGGSHGQPYVPAGTVPTLTHTAASGQQCTASAPITIQADTGSQPLIKGLVRFSNLKHWTFDNIDVTWHSGTYDQHMLKLTAGANWTWKNSEIWGANSFANILVAANSSGNPDYWTLANNCVHSNLAVNDPDPQNNRSHLIYVASINGSNGGTITRNILYKAIAGQGIKLDDGSGTKSPTNVTVNYNTIFDTSQNLLLVSDEAANNTLEKNLLVKGTAGMRAYSLDPALASTNSIKNLGYWDVSKLVVYYPDNGGRLTDNGGHVSQDPQFDAVNTCSGFKPQNPAMQAFGRYADLTQDDQGSGGTGGTTDPLTDTAAPSVSIVSPADGTTVKGVVTISAGAADDIAVASIEIYIDGKLHARADGATISSKWNTKKVSNGSHTIVVKAYDTSGNIGTSSISVKK